MTIRNLFLAFLLAANLIVFAINIRLNVENHKLRLALTVLLQPGQETIELNAGPRYDRAARRCR